MSLRYNQFKNDHTAIGTIITWAGTSTPNGYLQCDGTTYTITGVSNTRYRGLASVVSGQYEATDSYPYGDLNGTGTFTVPNMSPDDVAVQRQNETLGSRGGSTTSAFGNTSYGPRDAGSGLGMGPRTNFSYNMGNAGENSPSAHTHSTNPIQQGMRMQFLIKAF